MTRCERHYFVTVEKDMILGASGRIRICIKCGEVSKEEDHDN